MSMLRNLSGIFFRQRNEETDSYENVCFEELRPEEQDRILQSRTPEFVRNMCKLLGQKLQQIGQQFDIKCN